MLKSADLLCHSMFYVEFRLLRKQPKCRPGSHRLAFSTFALDSPHLRKALVQVGLPAELSFLSLSTSFPGPGMQKHSCGNLPVTQPPSGQATSQVGLIRELCWSHQRLSPCSATPRGALPGRGHRGMGGRHPLFGSELRAW